MFSGLSMSIHVSVDPSMSVSGLLVYVQTDCLSERYSGPKLPGSAGNMLAESSRKADMIR